MSDGVKPAESAEKTLGEIVTEVTQKATFLVQEEIELAKAEVTQKVRRISRGAIFVSVAAVMLFYFSIFIFVFLALGLNDWFNLKDWVGFLIVSVIFLVVTAIAAALGVRAIKRGAPPTPELAIEEARRTRAVLEEARS
jgi:protein-S-isoprenylcysteine O-methyltransferase Ste14